MKVSNTLPLPQGLSDGASTPDVLGLELAESLKAVFRMNPTLGTLVSPMTVKCVGLGHKRILLDKQTFFTFEWALLCAWPVTGPGSLTAYEACCKQIAANREAGSELRDLTRLPIPMSVYEFDGASVTCLIKGDGYPVLFQARPDLGPGIRSWIPIRRPHPQGGCAERVVVSDDETQDVSGSQSLSEGEGDPQDLARRFGLDISPATPVAPTLVAPPLVLGPPCVGTEQISDPVAGPENLIGPRNLASDWFVFEQVDWDHTILDLSVFEPLPLEYPEFWVMRDAPDRSGDWCVAVAHELLRDKGLYRSGERARGIRAAEDPLEWVNLERSLGIEKFEGWVLLDDEDALGEDFIKDVEIVGEVDCLEACEGEYDQLLDEDFGAEFESSPPPIRLAIGEEAPPIAPSQVQPFWVGGNTEEACLAPVICADSIPWYVHLLNTRDRLCGRSSRTAFEMRPAALKKAGLCEGDLVYNRLRDDHIFNSRSQAGGATRLLEVHSLVCKEGELRIVDVKTVKLADGRRYEVGRLSISAARPGPARILAKTGWSGFSFTRIALTPKEDLCLERAALASLPSELAKVRFQYAVATPYLPAEMQGLYRDILSEHVASERPQAFNAVKIGREISEYNRSLAQMGGRTLPITLA